MKNLIVGTTALACLGCFAQGTVDFANIGAGINAPVFFFGSTNKVSGSDYRAGLFAGPTESSMSFLADTPFLSGAHAGYFSGGQVSIPSVPGGGTARVQIVVWDTTLCGTTANATFFQAKLSGLPAWGASAILSIATGDPDSAPPGLPAALVGLGSLTLGWGTPPPPTQEFYYVTNDGTITITKYGGSGYAVIIPSEINGLPVTAIGNAAFVGSQVQSVEIPDTVMNIADGAFWNCASLREASLGRSVTNIGNSAFNGCFAFVSVAIPDSVIRIGDWAFENCGFMASLTLGSNIVYIGDEAFQGCSGLSTAITITKGSIGVDAFMYAGVTNVTLGSGVTSVGGRAFFGCARLTGATIGSGVTNIGVGVFAGCTS
ncbi:MAG: leucine-rich repeat protein, partial [Candidatus Dormibacteraceae bacterium]